MKEQQRTWRYGSEFGDVTVVSCGSAAWCAGRSLWTSRSYLERGVAEQDESRLDDIGGVYWVVIGVVWTIVTLQ